MGQRLSRRALLKLCLGVTAGAVFTTRLVSQVPRAYGFSYSDPLRKFVAPMRRVGAPDGIPLAVSDGTRAWAGPSGTVTATHYTLEIGQFEDRLHPDLPNPTRLWGYGQPGSFKHLSGVIVAKRDEPVQITFLNNLPAQHILPVDHTVMGHSPDTADNRTSVHLHGGFVPWISDGGPFDTWTPTGARGRSFLNNAVLRPGQNVPANEAEYYYPNHQSARLMWYHDHAWGNTRLNAYAGVASAYVIYDDYELSLRNSPVNLPGPLDSRTIYMAFQDKTFVPQNVATADPTWSAVVPGTRAGDFWYAHVYEPERWELAPGGSPPHPSVVPEFFGDTILVNGTAFPYLELEPRQYRFRILNACNSRFLNPRLVYAQSSADTEPNVAQPGPGFVQIGNEGGLLPAPTQVSASGAPLLLLAPAERADLIVDLREVAPGARLILYNDAGGPFPDGDSLYDFYPGNPDTPQAAPGFGPNTRTLLQIRIRALSGAQDAPIALPSAFTPTDPFLVAQTPGTPITYSATLAPGATTATTRITVGAGANVREVDARVRYLTLNESFDAHGRLRQLLGINRPVNPGAGEPVFGREYLDPPTEVIQAGSYEIWEIANLSADTHPIHLHLATCMILSRQAIGEEYRGGLPTYVGASSAAQPYEFGWKETVRANPGEVIRILMKFDLPADLPFAVPVSPRTGGHEYVWHCHILEHEEHDMMRPLVVYEGAQLHKGYFPVVQR